MLIFKIYFCIYVYLVVLGLIILQRKGELDKHVQFATLMQLPIIYLAYSQLFT